MIIFHNFVEKDKLKGKKVRSSAKDRAKATEALEDMKIRKMAEFQARDAKRKRRNKGHGDKNGVEPQGAERGGPKKNKRKSHFENEITNTKSAREFRHQPKNQNQQPKKAGKKFTPKVYKTK